MNVSVVPQSGATFGGTLFELPEKYNPMVPLGVDRAFFYHLKRTFEAKGHTVGTVDQIPVADANILVFIGFRGGFDYYYRALDQSDRPFLVYFARESPAFTPHHAERHLTTLAAHFDLLLTWRDSLATIPNAETFTLPISPRQLTVDQSLDEPDLTNRKLLANVTSDKTSTHSEELYTERRRVIEFYDDHQPDEFTLYGLGWNNGITPADITKGRWDMTSYDVYAGVVDYDADEGVRSKKDAYANHKFALAFENVTGLDGYVSEKIFDVFAAGRVPVYWGASNVDEYLPSETYVDYRDFGNPRRLHEYLTSVTPAEYEAYRTAIEQFLRREADGFRADTVAADVSDYVIAAADDGRRSLPDPEPVKRIERAAHDDAITNTHILASVAEAWIDPPGDLSRADIVRKTVRAAYNNFAGQ